MDALGSYLKETRENLNLSIDKVVDDTHIVRKFVEAIEKDEFSLFPGEAYLKGFLRTYSEYLGLNSDDVVKRYEKIKMAESPTPMEQLIPKPTFDFKPIIVISTISLISLILIIGVIFLVINITKNMPKIQESKKIEKKEDKKNEKTGNVIQLVSKDAVYNLKKGDIVEFNIGMEKENLTVKELSPTVVVVDSQGKEYFLIKSYQQKIDLNNDQNSEFEVVLNYWDDKTANISFKLYGEEGGGSATVTSSDSSITTLQGDNVESIVKKPASEVILCDLNFSDETFIKYKVDDSPEVEAFYRTGSIVNIKAQKSFMISMSNAGAANLNFKNYNKTIKPGDTGKVEVKLVKWIQIPSGEYDLQMSSLK